jgi:hypothetical protein
MRTLVTLLALVALPSVGMAKDQFQASDFVKQQLNSIGAEPARTAAKNRAVSGTVTFQLLNASSGRQDGKQVFVSEGDKLVSLLKLPNPAYHGERFVSDGRKTLVADLRPGTYSALGDFVRVHNEILTEGLWGGTLSTGWALSHLDERNAKLQDRGLKKVDGRELHRVDYVPKKRSDLEIQLYFEPDTLRHVMSVYALTISPQMARSETQTARQQETRYRLEERFADFKSVDSLNLPERWTIRFTSEVSTTGAAGGDELPTLPGGGEVAAAGTTINTNGIGSGISPVTQFEVSVTSISHNVQLDPKNFEVK